MSRRLILVALVAAVLVALGLGIVAAANLLDARSLLAEQLTRASGRQVGIAGPIRLRPGILPGLRLRQVELGGPSEDSIVRSARAERLDLVFALWPLLRGQLELHRIRISNASLVLEEKAGAPGMRAGLDAGPLVFALERVRVRQLAIEWHWSDGSEALAAHVETLAFRAGEAGVRGEAKGAFDVIPFDLEGRYLLSAGADTQALAIRGRIAGADVSLEGKPVDADGDRRLELAFHFEAPHLGAVGAGVGRSWPGIGPVVARGRLALSPWKAGLSDVGVQVGDEKSAWLKLEGFLKDVRKRRGYAAKAEFGLNDVAALKPLVRDPPDIGSISGTLILDDQEGKHRIQELRVKGGRPGVFEIDASCRFEDVSGVDGLDATLHLEARDLAVVGELLHLDAPPIGPLELSGHGTAKRGELVTDGVRARLGRNQLEGAFTARPTAKPRPFIQGSLETAALYLEDLGLGANEASERSAPVTREALLSGEPLPWERLRILDGRLQGHAGEVIGANGPWLDAGRFEATLTGGRLNVAPLRFEWQQGRIDGSLVLDAEPSPPSLSLTARAQGVQLESLLAELDQRKAWSGALDASLDVRSQGGSLRALAEGLNGSASAICRGGTIDTRHAGLLTRDLFQKLRGARAKHASEKLNCFVVDLAIEQGVAHTNVLLLDAADIVIVGEGDVDLARDAWNLRIRPHPRDPGLLSTAANVRITGPLRDPRIRTVKGSLVTSATGALVHNVGHYSGLQRVWRKLTRKHSKPQPCDALLRAAP